MKLLIIDNYDSFTYNLFQYCGEIFKSASGDHQIIVKRNDQVTLDEVVLMKPDRIIISPGPGSPDDPKYFGICGQVIEKLGPTTPLLGVCLGMQGLSSIFGATITHASTPMHGKLSPIKHSESGVFEDLPQEIEIMRYHSLLVESNTLPDCLEVTAAVCLQGEEEKSIDELLTLGREIMAVKHKTYPIEGIQFHPESFGTEGGKNMLENFLDL